MPPGKGKRQLVPQFCIILRGPAGAGKSRLAGEIQQELSQKVAVIDTDIFNWQIVPGEDDKELVYNNVVALASNYLARGYGVIVAGLIITSEERGAIEKLRQMAESRRATFIDFYCRIPKHLALQRNKGRDKDIPDRQIEAWWDLAEDDKANVPWVLVELDMTLSPQECAFQILNRLGSTRATRQEEQR